MPIYEYECIKCGERFELLRRLGSSDTEIECPVCRAPKPQKVFSTFAMGGSPEGFGGDCLPGSPV